MRLNQDRLRLAMLDAHANTRRARLFWPSYASCFDYRAYFAEALLAQMKLQLYHTTPHVVIGKPFRTYDEMRRAERLAADWS